jgi:ELWxxDGT repeat protein
MKTPRLIIFSVFLLAVQTGIAQHAQPELIADIEPKSRGLFTNAYLNVFFPGKNTLYMMTDQRDLNYGGELYKTDGTTTGTMRLTDIAPGPGSSMRMLGVDLDGTFIFPTTPEFFDTGTRLWKTDGSPNGLQLITALESANGNPMELKWLARHNGKALFFAADQTNSKMYLGETDGTEAGTVLITEVQLPPGYAYPGYGDIFLQTVDDYVFFKVAAQNTSTFAISEQLWRTDGTEAGTITLATDLETFSPFTTAGGFVYYFSNKNFLWKTDGTLAGTSFVKEFNGWNFPRVYPFKNNVVVSGYETWISDGTPGGTQKVSDQSIHMGYTVFNDKFYAIRQDVGDYRNRMLFVTDGTPGGTSDVAFLGQSEGIFVMDTIPVVNNKLIVPFYTPQQKLALGTSDGVSSTISLLADIDPATSGGAFFSGIVYDGKAYFIATDAVNGQEPWVSDGTPQGTHMIREPAAKSTDGADLAYRPVDLNGTKFGLAKGDVGPDLFRLDENPLGATKYLDGWQHDVIGVNDNKLFLTDAGKVLMTDGQTSEVVLKDYNSLNDARLYPTGGGVTRLGSNYIMELLIQGSASEQTGRELWVTDGTPAGSKVLMDINAGTADGTPGTDPLAKLSESLAVFSGNDGTTGFELCKTDGTTAGTVLLKELLPGTNSSTPKNFFVDNGIALFSADDGSGAELWRTDGTVNGTYRIKDIHPTGSSSPGLFTKLGNYIYFFAAGDVGWSLWKTDGTEGGTMLVKDVDTSMLDYDSPLSMIESNGLLWANVHNSGFGRELLVSDGTNAGTQFIDIVAGTDGSNPVALVSVPGGIYFAANNQLWRSSGTKKFTTKVADQKSSYMLNSNGKLYFTATSELYGIEYFRLTPEKFDQEITFQPIGDIASGVASINLNATASSRLPVTFSADGNEVTIVNNIVTINGPGRVTITATQSGNDGFKATEISQTFCIRPATPSLGFSNSTPADPVLTSSIASVGTWTLNGIMLTGENGSTLVVRKAGSYTFATTIDGCHSVASAPYVVPLQEQTITFTETNHNFNQFSFVLNATASSGNAVTYSTNNNKLTITGSAARIEAPGKVTITATQTGSDLFKPASKSVTICIDPAKPLVIQQGNILTSDATIGNQWQLEGVAVTGATSKTFTPAVNGNYSVQVTVDGCIGPVSEVVAIVITGIENEMNDVSLYPNPARNSLYVKTDHPVHVEILNFVGQVVNLGTFDRDIELNVSSYSRGIYFVKLTRSGRTVVQKILKE